MRHRVRINDVKWKWCVAAQLLLNNLPDGPPEDREDAVAVIDMVVGVINSCSQRGWQREQQVAYVVSMLPEDREAALRFASGLLARAMSRAA